MKPHYCTRCRKVRIEASDYRRGVRQCPWCRDLRHDGDRYTMGGQAAIAEKTHRRDSQGEPC